MKYTAFMLVMVWSLNCMAAEYKNNHTTTARLPRDHMIWPLPKIDVTKDIAVVGAKFIEAKEILSVVQGNYRHVIHLVKYSVTKGHQKYPFKEITFIVKDSWPTQESGIKAKKLPFAFRNGSKTFFMIRDRSCRYRAYFNIITYH